MSSLQVRMADRQSVREKAIEDAKEMQQRVVETANRANKDPPKYMLLELIGKGSFGRVYKAKDVVSARVVAVKIIDLDESDTVNPRLADTYSEFMREVNALKTLSESKAKNINHVIEALPVGQAMWMITEYCAGGSIATLMKPTIPSGLQEKWIIPILRELAEAIKWVHQAGIIHRDIKCANVLITEEGGLQLCDFGVSGTLETKVDKRTTMVGTPHWMAPELFEASPSYGKEVDIWAFGAMAYELATGLPPNVLKGITQAKLGQHLKKNVPRLEGGNFSSALRSIVAFCMEENPMDRPPIEQIQKHHFINNTSSAYPASSLAELVKAFKRWEDHGGSRKSLFMRGGAQAAPELASTALSDDLWNFSTTAAFDENLSNDNDLSDVIKVYGAAVSLNTDFSEETTKAIHKQLGREKGRRRPPPEALAPMKAPLEKIFDPNTISNYEDNSRVHYGRRMQPPASDLPLRDLPLRDNSKQSSVRESRIDLGGHDMETGLSNFPDLDTIKASRRSEEEDIPSTLPDFSRPPRSDPSSSSAESKTNRRTQDWKFPTMSTPMSADPEMSHFPIMSNAPDARPALIHTHTEPIGNSSQLSLMVSEPNSPNRMSLIDLDLGMPTTNISSSMDMGMGMGMGIGMGMGMGMGMDRPRPSTANSDVGSATSEIMLNTNPFDLERHAGAAPIQRGYFDSSSENEGERPESMINLDDAEPAIFLSNSNHNASNNSSISSTNQFNLAASNIPTLQAPQPPIPAYQQQDFSINSSNFDLAAYSSLGGGGNNSESEMNNSRSIGDVFPEQQFDFSHFPELPAPPSEAAMSGMASRGEMLEEFGRMFNGLEGQLGAFRDVYEGLGAGRSGRAGGRGR